MFRRLHSLRDFWETAGTVAKSANRSRSDMFLEFLTLRRALGMTAAEYFMYGLFEGGRTREDRMAYLTRALHEKYLAPLDPPEYSHLISDKLEFHRHFEQNGIRLPRLLGWLPAKIGCTQSTAQKIDDGLVSILRELPNLKHGFVIKPSRGGCGRGVMVFSAFHSPEMTLEHVDGRKFAASDITKRIANEFPTIIEERVRQCSFLDSYNPATLNTIRIVTIRDEKGIVHLAGASLKIGLDNSGVESLTAQHLAVPINLVNGELGIAARQDGVRCERFSAHPISAIAISGTVLPNWSDVKSLALKAADVVPQIRSIGWDIGLAIDGPVLIEGNEIWGEEILQIASGRGLWTSDFKSWIGASAAI